MSPESNAGGVAGAAAGTAEADGAGAAGAGCAAGAADEEDDAGAFELAAGADTVDAGADDDCCVTEDALEEAAFLNEPPPQAARVKTIASRRLEEAVRQFKNDWEWVANDNVTYFMELFRKVKMETQR